MPAAARLAALLALPMLLSTGCEVGSGEALARNRFGNCAPCHGAAGEGNREVGAPPIAGLPQWYVEAQLDKFRAGQRGLHPDDIDGMKMRPMARTLLSQDEVKAVAQLVAQLRPTAQPPTLSGDAGKGKALYATCAACHGERGAGQQAQGAPDLHKSADWYLLAQLKKFKAGIRGAAAGDVTGAQMRPMASTLTDEQAMKDVLAYIQTLSP